MTTQQDAGAGPRDLDQNAGTQPSPQPFNRRQALVAAGLGAGALTLAACGSSSTASAGSSSTAAATVTPTATSTAAPVSTSSAASSAAASSVVPTTASSAAATTASSAAPTTSASSAAPAVQGLVALSKVPVGGAVAAKDASGADIIVAQPTAGKVVAFSAVCTHQGCTVAVAAASGAELDCPCHGSKFNALTGAVLHGPAPKPLPSVAVKVSGGSVVAG